MFWGDTMSRHLATIALLCFSTTTLALSPTAQDNRMAIQVSSGERNQILFEMRDFLHGLFNVNNALANKDMKELAISATPIAGLMERLPIQTKAHLPEEFTQMAIGMSELVNVLVRDAQTKGDVSLTQSQLAELISYCSGCHDSYRLETVTARMRR